MTNIAGWVRVVAVAAIVVALAASATSYQSAVSVQPLGGGTFLITADGNGFTGSSTIEHYKYRRAAELCPGGFDVIDANQSTRTNLATFDGGKTYNTVNKPSGSLAIRCRAPAVAAPPRPAEPKGFWCTVDSDLGFGSCFRAQTECENFRLAIAKNCPEGGKCESSACATSKTAFCAPSGCSTTPNACIAFEKHAGRDGAACAVGE
jgi:hypothetical protein